jgi:hypothetical protein
MAGSREGSENMGKMKAKKPRGFWEISANIATMYGHRARVAAIKAGEIGQRLPTTEELIFGKKPKTKRR